MDDSLRSVVGRAIAVHAHPFGSIASNPVIAWGIFGLANPGVDTNVARWVWWWLVVVGALLGAGCCLVFAASYLLLATDCVEFLTLIIVALPCSVRDKFFQTVVRVPHRSYVY